MIATELVTHVRKSVTVDWTSALLARRRVRCQIKAEIICQQVKESSPPVDTKRAACATLGCGAAPRPSSD
ncbi:MAG: hypothetical protein KJ072_21535 [Verrucomicrobia bacterium]|nr:hypothetical protein [Verrucomicrobiota bacterium]